MKAQTPKRMVIIGAISLAVVWAAASPSSASASHSGTSTGTNLAAMLEEVPDGGTLILPPGTYRGDIVIDRPVRIEGRESAVIVGSGLGTVITIRAPGTVITGVRVSGSGPGPTGQPSAIRIEADQVEVQAVVIEDSYTGIAVTEANGVRLVDNIISGRSELPIPGESHILGHDEHKAHAGRGDAISLWHAEGVLVRGNTITGARDGIYVSFGSGALIDANSVSESRYGVHSMYATDLVMVENDLHDNLSGAVLMYGGPTLLLRNSLVANNSPSTGFAVLLKDVTGVEIVQNVLADNRVGLHLDGSPGDGEPAIFTANTLARNEIGVSLFPSAAAVFKANSFVGNAIQVLRQGGGDLEGITWSSHGFGNYWSNYRGFDATGNGKGAISHVEGSAVDRLLQRAPVLMPLASSPALRLVRAVEDRWVHLRPVVVDEVPLTVPLSPPVTTPAPERQAGVALAGLGLVAVVVASTTITMLSRTTTRYGAPDAA